MRGGGRGRLALGLALLFLLCLGVPGQAIELLGHFRLLKPRMRIARSRREVAQLSRPVAIPGRSALLSHKDASPASLSTGQVGSANNLAILCRTVALGWPSARGRNDLGWPIGGRETLLGLVDKLLQHRANIVIRLGREQDAIALQTRAVGLRIVEDEALCHGPILAARLPRVTLGWQRR